VARCDRVESEKTDGRFAREEKVKEPLREQLISEVKKPFLDFLPQGEEERGHVA